MGKLIITDADISPRTVRRVCTALKTQFNLGGAEGFTCYWLNKEILLKMPSLWSFNKTMELCVV